jgi:DNA-binding NtrC family response regulator
MHEQDEHGAMSGLPPESSRFRLLVADDDVGDLDHYSTILKLLGYDVRPFASYREAADYLGQETFDLVVVSQGTANFEGRLVLESAIARDRNTRVLVLTPATEMACYLEAMQLGAVNYMEKPMPPSEIGKLVARHLHFPTASVEMRRAS